MLIAKKALYLFSKGQRTIYGYPITELIDCLVVENPSLDKPDLEGNTKLTLLRKEIESWKKPN